MIYQLFDMVSYGYLEPMIPFTLLYESKNFEEIYSIFLQKNKQKIPCAIFIKTEDK